MKADKNLFLSKHYIIDRAAKWFGFGVSFNMVADIKAEYNREGMTTAMQGKEPEEVFESALMKYIDRFNQAKENGELNY